jgi:hypothetical protein
MHIVALIASHIESVAHIDALERCIYSLINQTVQPDKIIVSVSFDTTFLKRKSRTLIAMYNVQWIVIKFNKLSTFEHYAGMMPFLGDYDICMFCPDNSLSHPERVAEYHKAASRSDRFMFGPEAILTYFTNTYYDSFPDFETIEADKTCGTAVISQDMYRYFNVGCTAYYVKTFVKESKMGPIPNFLDFIKTLSGPALRHVKAPHWFVESSRWRILGAECVDVIQPTPVMMPMPIPRLLPMSICC